MKALAAAAVLIAAGVAWAASGGGEGAAAPAASDVATATAEVERRDLVDREDVAGELAFAGAQSVRAGGSGTITGLRAEGARVARGQSLFSVDAEPTAFVLYGRMPMYRTLGAGASEGPDVRQLERNLVALGHDPDGEIEVDDAWDGATTAAVMRWEEARGATADGVVEPGDVVFAEGPARMGRHAAEVGDAARPGAPVTELTERRREIVARLPASRQGAVRRGDAVDVTLPDGSAARGRVARVGRVAQAGADGAEATVELRVRLKGEAARGGLDRAPVTVSIATGAAEDVLAVPVTALLATAPGAYAVELADGRVVPVEPGAFGDGYVEVEGDGIREGARVVVPL